MHVRFLDFMLVFLMLLLFVRKVSGLFTGYWLELERCTAFPGYVFANFRVDKNFPGEVNLLCKTGVRTI